MGGRGKVGRPTGLGDTRREKERQTWAGTDEHRLALEGKDRSREAAGTLLGLPTRPPYSAAVRAESLIPQLGPDKAGWRA